MALDVEKCVSLLSFRSNIYSQNGEDGVIAELVRRLGLDEPADRWCVEVGAWDGKHLSNTFRLVEDRNWNAIYIEADPAKFRDLEATAAQHCSIEPILGAVGNPHEGRSTLDALLSETPLPVAYDLLSIDIDSSDLEVWAQHREYRASIVVLEINSSIRPGILQWHSSSAPGNSFSSTINVARHMGYTLACHTGNLIFVADEFADAAAIDATDRLYPERLFLRDWIEAEVSAANQPSRAWAQTVGRTVRRGLEFGRR